MQKAKRYYRFVQMTMEMLWDKLTKYGQNAGCHQMPERSFTYHGRQFPVCARCTGVIIGHIAGIALLFIYAPRLWIPFLCGTLMFLDWFVQLTGIRESTNLRRLITGILGGYAISTVLFAVLLTVIQSVFHI